VEFAGFGNRMKMGGYGTGSGNKMFLKNPIPNVLTRIGRPFAVGNDRFSDIWRRLKECKASRAW